MPEETDPTTLLNLANGCGILHDGNRVIIRVNDVNIVAIHYDGSVKRFVLPPSEDPHELGAEWVDSNGFLRISSGE